MDEESTSEDWYYCAKFHSGDMTLTEIEEDIERKRRVNKKTSEDVLEYSSITELKEIINEKLKKHRDLVCCPENCFCWEFEQDIFNEKFCEGEKK